ncbi:uncharacterized protein LOC111342480 isoform X2 [Stylophora pistillata]|uniref:Uncharacterized protein n=2 Tax=Stylophora pistillata TaxID=50429 RepID=A0A2B4RHE9_STYPI|nr:uncharacterized protein LOC111342480 isoform X2 [Stylophora pistillata]XP_022805301.1 uncharacterized protein LOC111342480 isoform X2 [Stylophora pistillata]XP_022805302.1 uncharacterized protein LOC111342480 isoform X2 [Stylophora pistillata]XP_022805303.1 uncharacterized protein LOC111342480 isoform X2 [Stylophora pistillata]PFX16229.1 hypothetical protein AWC38_SpisGene19505 [Stylophora pistillata]
MAKEEGYCDGIQKMYGKKIPFDPEVKYVIDKGIEETREMDPEERARVIESAGYLAFDIMIVESMGDHKDANVAKRVKQAAEKFIKDQVGKITNEAPHKYAKLLEDAKEAAEKKREKIFSDERMKILSEGKKQAAKKASKRENFKGLHNTCRKVKMNGKAVASRAPYDDSASLRNDRAGIVLFLLALQRLRYTDVYSLELFLFFWPVCLCFVPN